jgi:phosphopantothenoylcysteine synthetase/decarboxylase
VRTPDILRTLGGAKGRLFLVGFAAETDQVLEHAREKRRAKNVDLWSRTRSASTAPASRPTRTPRS